MTLYILGLDGASLDNLGVAMERIELPNFRKLMKRGQSFDLKSVYPCVTGPAWTSLFSGVNPGKHGIFDQFTYRGSELVPANMRQTEVPFLWDYLAWAGKRTLIMGVPFIFPPPKVNGIFVTGTFCPKVSSSPAEVARDYDLSGFEYGELTAEQAFEKILQSGSAWSKAVISGLEKRVKVASKLMDSETWDVVVAIDALPDEIFHIGGGDRRIEDDMFRGLDEWVGTILSKMKGVDELLVVSDHGFSPLDRVFFINEWLRRKGYLRKKESRLTRTLTGIGLDWDIFGKRGVASRAYAFALRHFPGLLNRLTAPLRSDLLLSTGSDDQDTRAMAFNSGGPVSWIRVNDRSETGVSTEESLVRDLGELKEAGVVKNIFRVTELYSGKCVQRSPGTILVESNDGLAIDARRMFTKDVVGMPLLTKVADHRMNGILIYSGKSTIPSESHPSVYDIAPTVMGLLKMPVPAYFDGRDLLRTEKAPRLNIPKSL